MKYSIQPGIHVGVRLLSWLGACSEEVDHFKQVFPKGLKLTKDNIHRALEAGVAVHWFMDRVLTTSARIDLMDKTSAKFRVWTYVTNEDNRQAYYRNYVDVAWGLIQDTGNLRLHLRG